MLLGSDDNENKLFGSDSTPSSDKLPEEKETLFSSSYNNSSSSDNTEDELVDSSFAISFKANDPVNSVSEKLKETSKSALDEEFDDFVFNPAVSAFKPINMAEVVNNEFTTNDKNPTTFDGEPKPVKPTEQEKDIVAPVFTTAESGVDQNKDFDVSDPDLMAFAGDVKADPFKAGDELDFATSTNNQNSSFANPTEDDLQLDEAAMNINPFKSNAPEFDIPAPTKEAAPVEAPAPAPVETPAPVEAPAPTPAPVKAPATESSTPVNNEVKGATPEKKSNLQTYGKVTSGVGAFGRRRNKEENKEPEVAPAVAPTPVAAPTETKADVKAPASEATKEEAAKSEVVPPVIVPTPDTPKAPVAPQQKAAAPAPAPASKPVPPQAQAKAPVQQKAPIKRPASATRPGAVNKGTESPFAPRGGAMVNKGAPRQAQRASAAAQKGNIQPITTVDNKKRRKEKTKKEPGKGSLIALAVVFLLVLVVFFVLENFDNWFGGNKKSEPTVIGTVQTTKAENETEAPKEETTVATEETTKATETSATETSETTEATETSATETSESTEATTTTEEATTTTTAAATTTSKPSGEKQPEPQLSYHIKNASSTTDGFKFDIEITNNGNEDVNLSGRLDNMTIKISTGTKITSLTSDYFTFTSGDTENSFVGTATSKSIPANTTTYVTINAKTDAHTNSFYIDSYHFTWK